MTARRRTTRVGTAVERRCASALLAAAPAPLAAHRTAARALIFTRADCPPVPLARLRATCGSPPARIVTWAAVFSLLALLSCCWRSYFYGLGAGVAAVFSYLGGLAGGRAGSLVVGCSPLLAVRSGGGLSLVPCLVRSLRFSPLPLRVCRARRGFFSPLRPAPVLAFRCVPGLLPVPRRVSPPSRWSVGLPRRGAGERSRRWRGLFCAGYRPRLARVCRYTHLYPQKYYWRLYFFLPPSGRGYPSRPSGGSRLADRQLADINDARFHAYASTNVVNHPLPGRTEKVHSCS